MGVNLSPFPAYIPLEWKWECQRKLGVLAYHSVTVSASRRGWKWFSVEQRLFSWPSPTPARLYRVINCGSSSRTCVAGVAEETGWGASFLGWWAVVEDGEEESRFGLTLPHGSRAHRSLHGSALRRLQPQLWVPESEGEGQRWSLFRGKMGFWWVIYEKVSSFLRCSHCFVSLLQQMTRSLMKFPVW